VSSASPAAPGSSGSGALPGAGSLLATRPSHPKKDSSHKSGHHAPGGHLRPGSVRLHRAVKARVSYRD
jgi:hypothetical protein